MSEIQALSNSITFPSECFRFSAHVTIMVVDINWYYWCRRLCINFCWHCL